MNLPHFKPLKWTIMNKFHLKSVCFFYLPQYYIDFRYVIFVINVSVFRKISPLLRNNNIYFLDNVIKNNSCPDVVKLMTWINGFWINMSIGHHNYIPFMGVLIFCNELAQNIFLHKKYLLHNCKIFFVFLSVLKLWNIWMFYAISALHSILKWYFKHTWPMKCHELLNVAIKCYNAS